MRETFQQAMNGCKGGLPVEFKGKVQMPADPFITEKERVRMAAVSVWKAIGYRFT
jgi:hypothetical protein